MLDSWMCGYTGKHGRVVSELGENLGVAASYECAMARRNWEIQDGHLRIKRTCGEALG